MMVLITYDINTDIARICKNKGQRVQNSVFECVVDPAQWAALRQELLGTMNKKEDSLRFYFLGNNWKKRVEHVGAKPTYDPEGPRYKIDLRGPVADVLFRTGLRFV